MEEELKTPAFVDGERVYLRPLREAALNDRYLDWLNDAEVTRFLEAGTFPETPAGLRAFYEAMHASKTDVLLAICDKATDRHIGNIKLGGINWIHRYADLGILIGEKDYWHKGCGREACRLLLRYAFETLNLNKVILGVYSNHAAAIRTYEQVGFRVEGHITGLLNFEGTYVDKVLMGISKEQFAAD